MEPPQTLDELRSHIDRLDRQIVSLIAERGTYVKQAAQFKKTSADVEAPKRVEQVIEKTKNLAAELGANPTVVENVYRVMIASFIDLEHKEHVRLNPGR